MKTISLVYICFPWIKPSSSSVHISCEAAAVYINILSLIFLDNYPILSTVCCLTGKLQAQRKCETSSCIVPKKKNAVQICQEEKRRMQSSVYTRKKQAVVKTLLQAAGKEESLTTAHKHG